MTDTLPGSAIKLRVTDDGTAHAFGMANSSPKDETAETQARIEAKLDRLIYAIVGSEDS